MPTAEVSADEVKAAQRAAMTRIEVVEVVREITVEVLAPLLAPGSYTECEVCVGRGMRDRGRYRPPSSAQSSRMPRAFRSRRSRPARRTWRKPNSTASRQCLHRRTRAWRRFGLAVLQ
ncbi:hypothetical protein ACFY0A_30390 [Streptomyces sp. NPDC001698]|uniref:hypothetical protein n=1 Tax=Streptomyces sp. NPDC001698 TaxID=3364601 RepID=UPI00368F4A03